MNMQLLLALQVFILPLALSAIAWRFASENNRFTPPALLLIWLVSYVWIKGLPSIPPAEAIEWVGPLGLLFIVIIFFTRQSTPYTLLFISLLTMAGILLLTWPLIVYAPTPQLFAELIFFSVVGTIIAFRVSRVTPTSPALTLGISNAGLAVVSGLGGSLLIGQLAGVLASGLGAFIIYELYRKLSATMLDSNTTLLMVLINLWLLLIARLYADIALAPVVLLALALLSGLTMKWRYASAVSLMAAGSSLLWLLLTTDSSSYY